MFVRDSELVAAAHVESAYLRGRWQCRRRLFIGTRLGMGAALQAPALGALIMAAAQRCAKELWWAVGGAKTGARP